MPIIEEYKEPLRRSKRCLIKCFKQIHVSSYLILLKNRLFGLKIIYLII